MIHASPSATTASSTGCKKTYISPAGSRQDCTEAIVSEGIDEGEVRRICTEADCPIHHLEKQSTKANASFKAEQDRSRKEQALANATGRRVLKTIVAAVPAELMKLNLLFVVERMHPLFDDKRQEMFAHTEASGREKANPQPSCSPSFSARPRKTFLTI